MSWWSLEDVFKTSWRHLEDFLKTLLQDVLARGLEDILKKSWKLFKTSLRRLEDVWKTLLQDVLKTSWRRMTKTNILVWIKTSWRRLEDAFWRRMTKANIFVLIKTSWRCFLKTKTKDVFKTSSSRQMFAGKKLTIIGQCLGQIS